MTILKTFHPSLITSIHMKELTMDPRSITIPEINIVEEISNLVEYSFFIMKETKYHSVTQDLCQSFFKQVLFY